MAATRPTLDDERSLFSRLGELMVFAELGSIAPALPILLNAPRGDGHAVLVLPGMLASDGSTFVLRRYLQALGYQVHPWKLGRNWGPSTEIRQGIRDRFKELSNRYQHRISIVGWSLGGIYARELAREYPALVRQVITLGSPFGAGYRVEGEPDPKLAARLRPAPPVPCTAIYSKSDGVVPWEACLEQEGPQTDNIEVQSSHIGMGINALVLWAVADRLSQAEGRWRHFDRTGLHGYFFRETE
ncbi:MAG: alpha/beta hydrolase [Parvibaculum sp.]|uniref:alpha/beta hydrolase n=1 Tax=Parvibaculum sp. TaxID=2024848 RepID=UPI0025D92688|nr:alpha/beta hydrolase [Parvibaculum sp.]MCE9650804.1 alpha/beta hydrolase [Parvibaculum sp.]